MSGGQEMEPAIRMSGFIVEGPSAAEDVINECNPPGNSSPEQRWSSTLGARLWRVKEPSANRLYFRYSDKFLISSCSSGD
jgi:hypothetical protein